MGDEIELLFKQEATEITQAVTVTTISNGGKSAHFNTVIPNEITAETFDLYGVYGGAGLSTTDPQKLYYHKRQRLPLRLIPLMILIL